MSQQCSIQVRYQSPAAALRPYFTTYYHVACQVPDGGEITDFLLPEWANLRFYSGSLPSAENLAGERLHGTSFPVTGPSSEAIRFSLGSGQLFGIGVLPLGWAKFVHASARNMADGIFDGNRHQAFAGLRPLVSTLCQDDRLDPADGFDAITRFFIAALDRAPPDDPRIATIHAALLDRDVASVDDMVALSQISKRTLERVCSRAFGFPPKYLLRRQRFMRSLTHFLHDPSLGWIGAIDSQYHDQAQFVHDFRRFMGMSPRAYARLDKPMITEILRARAQLVGTTMNAEISRGSMLAPD